MFQNKESDILDEAAVNGIRFAQRVQDFVSRLAICTRFAGKCFASVKYSGARFGDARCLHHG